MLLLFDTKCSGGLGINTSETAVNVWNLYKKIYSTTLNIV